MTQENHNSIPTQLLFYQSEKLDQILPALNRAQTKAAGVVRDASNIFFKSHYAPLENYIEAFQKYYSPEGLSFTQTGMVVDEKLFLSTTVYHASGQWIRSLYPVNPEKPGPQAFGACWTYAKRYDLAGITGLPSFDDDGETGEVRTPIQNQSQRVLSQNKAVPAMNKMPEGSNALTAKQLELIRYRKKEKGVDDAAYLKIVKTIAGVEIDNRIPFAKVSDVLGALDGYRNHDTQ